MPSCGEVEVEAAMNGPLQTPLAAPMKSGHCEGARLSVLEKLDCESEPHVPRDLIGALGRTGVLWAKGSAGGK